MGIIFDKRGGVGMGATRPEPAPLPFLPELHQNQKSHIYLRSDSSQDKV